MIIAKNDVFKLIVSFTKTSISIFINYVLLSKQKWSFTAKLKINHLFIIKGLFEMSAFDVINIKVGLFTAWFVIKKEKRGIN